MSFGFVSMAEAGLARSAEVLTEAFTGYYVSIAFTASSLLECARVDGVDLERSVLVLDAGVPIGGALVARRGWTSRVASMATISSARRRGAGRALMEHLVTEASARGDRAIELEVIEDNAPARRLYEAFGFVRVRRLVGHVGRPPSTPAEGPLEEIDVAELARATGSHAPDDLPWQIAAPTIARLGPPHVALRHGPSYVLIGDPAGEVVTLRCLGTEPGQRRRGHALRLLRALFARYPEKEWRVPALWPEEVAPLFARLGFSEQPIRQLQLRRRLH